MRTATMIVGVTALALAAGLAHAQSSAGGAAPAASPPPATPPASAAAAADQARSQASDLSTGKSAKKAAATEDKSGYNAKSKDELKADTIPDDDLSTDPSAFRKHSDPPGAWSTSPYGPPR